jgi:hypothetical protein
MRPLIGTSFGVTQVTSTGSVVRRTLTGSTNNRTVVAATDGLLTAPASDERLKNNIEPLTLGLDLVEKLNPKKYEFKSAPGLPEYGLIAQELRETLRSFGVPDNVNLVFEDTSEDAAAKLPEGEEGPVLGIEYVRLIPILINSIKELKARIDVLEKEKDN